MNTDTTASKSLNFLFIFAAVFILGIWAWVHHSIQRDREIQPVPSDLEMGPSTGSGNISQDPKQRWLQYFQIWHCDDGSYEVRSDQFSKGRFLTLDDARKAKTNIAKAMVQWELEHEHDPIIAPPRVPDCGKRIE